MSDTSRQPELRQGMSRRVVQVLGGFLFLAALLFASAGTLRWSWAWVFLGLYLAIVGANAVLMLRRSPELIARRSESAGQVRWDRVVGRLWVLAGLIGVPVVAGLDQRFSWSSGMALAWHWLGAFSFVAGLVLFSWAMLTNAFFSTVVRIQTDQGHKVCTGGPYRFVRHPGYVGAIVQWLGVPLLLGSWWALLPGVLAAVLMVVRTALEDRTLQAQLEGYAAYAARVRYRLLPGVW